MSERMSIGWTRRGHFPIWMIRYAEIDWDRWRPAGLEYASLTVVRVRPCGCTNEIEITVEGIPRPLEDEPQVQAWLAEVHQ